MYTNNCVASKFVLLDTVAEWMDGNKVLVSDCVSV